MNIDHNLLEFCNTDKQKTYLTEYLEHGSYSSAANQLGVDESTVRKAVERVKQIAIDRGYAPEYDMTNPAPEGFIVKGTSTYYDKDGNKVGQWVKTSKEYQDFEKRVRAALAGLSDNIPKATPSIERAKDYLTDIINQYTITDYHFGMLAWHEETGADWDVDIAEQLIIDWFKIAIEKAPDSETAILAQLGDFMHFDGLEAVTPSSGHVLDADTRFQKLVRVVIRAVRAIVDMLLEKHKNVHIIMAEGNHDLASSIWLRELFDSFYENDPRVTVDTSATPYYCYEFGETALFYHHGHKKRIASVDTVFAAMFREVFGRTKHAFAHMGHLHSVDIKETNLMIVEQHRTLAAPDAYASRGGWISGRDAKVITYHKKYGEVGRLVISSDMIKDRV